jgi:hypothetical protein
MNLDQAWICWLKEGTSDKVWGAVLVKKLGTVNTVQSYGNWMVFWGRRGKTMQGKILNSMGQHWVYKHYVQKKLDKGYTLLDKTNLSEVYPEFQQDLSELALLKSLSI